MNINVKRCREIHQKGGYATHPIMQFLSLPVLLLLLAWNGHAASSRLTGKLKNYILERVQPRNLGL